MMATRAPRFAREYPRLEVTIDLPTPPLPPPMAQTQGASELLEVRFICSE
jgi:hypothetical protein